MRLAGKAALFIAPDWALPESEFAGFPPRDQPGDLAV